MQQATFEIFDGSIHHDNGNTNNNSNENHDDNGNANDNDDDQGRGRPHEQRPDRDWLLPLISRPSSRWLTLWVLAAGAFAVNLDMRAIVPLLPSLSADLGVNVATAGLVATAYMLPYGAFQLVYGPLADRFGRLPVARGTLLVFALGTTLCGLVGSFETLVVMRFLTGAVAAASFPMGLAYVGDAFEYRDRPGAISVLITSSAVSQLLSLSLGGILAGFVSWRAIFYLDGVMAFLIVLALFWVRGAEKIGPRTSMLEGFGQLLGAGWRLVAILLAFVEGMLLMGGMTFLGAYLRDRWGLSYVAIGLCLGVYGAALVLSGKLLPWAARRFGESSRFVFGGVSSALGYLLISLVPSWEVATVMLILLGFGWTGAHAVLQARSTEILPSARGTAIAVFACGLFTGGSVGTAVVGAGINVLGYQQVFVLLAGALLLFTAGGWAGLRRVSAATSR
ncbi:MAG: MFS transporter [Chloroflexi bacterium]|nr:MFS transporter [Chloroflexota bacterium]